MKEEQTISWIFLSTAMASETRPTDFSGISMIADGINHAVPTQKELQSSLSWLIKHGLILKQGSKYSLSADGKMKYDEVVKKSNKVLEIWKNIEAQIKI